MSFSNPAFEWNFFFKQIDIREKSKDKLLILVNNELDIESLNVINKYVKSSKKVVKIRTVDHCSFENKMHDSFFKNKMIDVEKTSRYCFLMSSNIRLESAILNVKLRAKYLARDISILNLGLNSKLNLPAEYINLNMSNIVDFFEGKNFKLAKLFLIAKNPLFFFGLSFKNRFGKNVFTSHLKKFMPSSIIFILEESCNSSGLQLMNIKPLSNKDIDVSETLISINLKSILFARSFLNLNKTIESSWFGPHIPTIPFKYDMAISTNSCFEIEGTFLNLESRPQKTIKLGNKTSFIRSIKNIFLAIKEDIKKSSDFLNYIEEIVEDPKYFNLTKNKFVNFNNNKLYFSSLTRISFYPLKSSMEDFYMNDSLSKKSLTMSERSQETRKLFTNFI